MTLLKQVAFFYFVDACVVYDFFCGFFLFVFFLFLVFGLLCGGSWWFPRLARSRSFYLAPFVSLYVTRVPIILHPPVPKKKHPPPSKINPRDRRIPIPVSIENQRRSPLYLNPVSLPPRPWNGERQSTSTALARNA